MDCNLPLYAGLQNSFHPEFQHSSHNESRNAEIGQMGSF